MKKLKIFFIVIFFILLAIPVVTFRTEENAVSEVDNRMLAANPVSAIREGEDATQAIENYVNDRIGLRNEMIELYTVGHDKIFHEMIHPSYVYGKDGYVFLNTGGNPIFSDYHIAFADMIKKIQDYCEARGVPFLFVFEPAKTTVLQEKLEQGWNYDNQWVQQFLEELDRREIRYVDNTEILEEKTEEGEKVFNKKYDGGHWNELGAFYGVNHILEGLSEQGVPVHINTKEEFSVQEETMEKLLLSEIPIHEKVPVYERNAEVKCLTEQYSPEVRRDESFNHFNYYVNEQRVAEGVPRTLVFQGSYLNGLGSKFLENSLGEYISVHDYRNIFDFDYYFTMFQPECVVFEVAEYTFIEDYFPYEQIKTMNLPPVFESFEEMPEENLTMPETMYQVEEGQIYEVISIEGLSADTQYAYLQEGDQIFDLMRREDGVYTTTVEKQLLNVDNISIIAVESGKKVCYHKENR